MNYFDDIHFLGVNRLVSRQSYPLRPVSNDAFGMIVAGSVIQRSENECFEAEAPLIYWTSRGKVTCWINPPNSFRDNFWVDIAGPRAERMLAALNEDFPRGCIVPDNPVNFSSILEKMQLIWQQKIPARRYRLAVLAEQFVAEIYESHHQQLQQDRLYVLVNKVASAISVQPGIEYDFTAIAAQHQLSYDHFRRRFREYLGCPPHDFLLKCRLEQAIRLLHDEAMNIKEIAYRCGFENASDFSRFFRKRTGFTPSSYPRN